MEVVKPLSIDGRVWPTIFESEHRPGPIERSGVQNCWSDFFALRAAVTNAYQQQPMQAWHMIAITLLLGPYCAQDITVWMSRLSPVNPSRMGDDWGFLGYDVGDQWMLSVLLNCG